MDVDLHIMPGSNDGSAKYPLFFRVFKGGTSLAKGWNLIEWLSEDVDIFLDPRAFQPRLGKNAIDRELRKLRDAIGLHPALTYLPAESQTIGGVGRSDRFSYPQLFGGTGTGEVANRVLVEAGAGSSVREDRH